MQPEHRLDSLDDIAHNRRGQISEAQRRAARRAPWGGGCLGVVLVLIFATALAMPLLATWPEPGGDWSLGLLALLAVIAGLPLLVGGALFAIRWLLIGQDLAAGQIAQAAGTVRWRWRRYAAEVPGRPFWTSSTVSGLAPGPYRFYYLPQSGHLLSAEALPGLAPAGELPELVQVLGRVHGFGAGDLEANRAGRLGARQAAGLLLAAGVEGALALFVLVFAGFIAWSIFGERGGPAGMILAAVVGLIGPVLLGYSAAKSALDAFSGRVEQVTGTATRSVARSGRTTQYYYHLGGRRFSVSARAYQALVPDQKYRFYYTPRSGRLVGVELP